VLLEVRVATGDVEGEERLPGEEQ